MLVFFKHGSTVTLVHNNIINYDRHHHHGYLQYFIMLPWYSSYRDTMFYQVKNYLSTNL